MLGIAAAAGSLAAQGELAASCGVLSAGLSTQCAALGQAAAVAQPRIGLAAAGGNPLAGSSSTLGMRIGSTPRVAAALRLTGVHATLPAQDATLSGTARPDASSLALGLSGDVVVGLLAGSSPAPTVGGVGSLDLVGSLGVLPSAGSGFHSHPWTAGAGLRLGVLRESFTAPGITLSGMYRRTGAALWGTRSAVVPPSYLGSFRLGSTSDWSFRGVVGKRLFSIATSVGAGVDRYSNDTQLAWSCPMNAGCIGPATFDVTAPLKQTRANLFADLTWTSLVFTGTAELGWLRGGSPATVTPATGYEDLVRKSAVFGSLALRLTI
ncbi:MAG TPA: hypothetical protein VF832_14380 [Longimicrobiales bacterium]